MCKGTENQGLHGLADRMNICGCGQPWRFWQTLMQFLEALETDGHDERIQKVSAEVSAYDMAYTIVTLIEAAGLLEHGGSVFGAWLDKSGEEALRLFRKHGTDPDAWLVEWIAEG
jgi:hypothetical protein